MPAYIVVYDLHTPGQNYECLTEKIEAYGYYWHVQRSVWIIVTRDSAEAIRDNLKQCLDRNDKLLVARLSGEAAWSGYKDDDGSWLKSALS